MKVTAVIPTYNGAIWLPKSIPRVDVALKRAKLSAAEILIVNDGSTDNTLEVIGQLKTHFPIRVVTQENGGRFVARKTGTNRARYDHLLFVDTRVFIGKNSLKYVIDNYDENSDKVVWNSHVKIDKIGSIYARFWDAIAFVAWRKYFKNPRDVSYGADEFDLFPKGTTCFFIPKNVLEKSNDWFEKNTMDLKVSNDDTLLIRNVIESHNINLSPKFWCLYHARPSFRQFLKHVFHRGQVFVDGFLRNDGNRFFYPLIAFLILSLISPLLLVVLHGFLWLIIVGVLIAWVCELLVLLLLGVEYKDALSLFILTPIFSIIYGLGIWKAFIKLFIVRKFREKRE